jgi:hypothetical protein
MQKSLETFDSMPTMRAMNNLCTIDKVNQVSEENAHIGGQQGAWAWGKVRGWEGQWGPCPRKSWHYSNTESATHAVEKAGRVGWLGPSLWARMNS